MELAASGTVNRNVLEAKFCAVPVESEPANLIPQSSWSEESR